MLGNDCEMGNQFNMVCYMHREVTPIDEVKEELKKKRVTQFSKTTR